MTASVVQTQTSAFTTGSGTVTLGSPTTAGNTLVFCYSGDGTTGDPILSTVKLGGVADNFALVVTDTTNEVATMWADPNCAGGQTAVAYTTTGGTGTLSIIITVLEVAGLMPIVPNTDKSQHNHASATTPWTTNATATTTQNYEFVVGFVGILKSGGGGPVTITGPGSPWTNITGTTVNSTFSQAVGYKSVTVTGAQTYNGTSSGGTGAYGAAIATFLSTGPTVNLTTPNIVLGAPVLSPPPPPSPVLTASWSGSFARNPLAYIADAPSLTPLEIPVSNTAGQWLIAYATWRQDAGTAGNLLYPSTVSISDDVGNFWVPLYSGLPASPTLTTPVTAGALSGSSAGTVSTAASGTLTIPWTAGPPVAGQKIVVVLWTANTITSVTDNGTTPRTFINAGNSFATPGNRKSYVFYADNITLPSAGSYTVTVATSGGLPTSGGGLALAGAKAGAPTSINGASGNSSLASTGTVIPSLQGAMYVAAFTDDTAVNPETITLNATGFTQEFLQTSTTFTVGAAAYSTDTAGPSSTICNWTLGDTTNYAGVIAVWDPINPPPTGIMRTAVWMAPAARKAQFVYFSPTSYQSGMVGQVLQFSAVCPWYAISAKAETFTNQGTSVSQSLTIPNGVAAFGAVCWDNLSASTVSIGSGSWLTQPSATCTNGVNTSGDISQNPFSAIGTGGTLTLTGSSATVMDWTATIVAISGISDLLPYPYGTPAFENWPVLITEIAAGPVLNRDPVMAQGTTFWTGTNAAAAQVSWPQWTPFPVNYQTMMFGSLQVTPSGSSSSPLIAAEREAISPVTFYTANAIVYSQAGYNPGGTGGAFVAINWLTSGLANISTSTGTAVPLQQGEWTTLSLGPVLPPQTAAFGVLQVGLSSGTASAVPASAVFYAAYSALGVGDSYEAVPPDQLAWSDISSRVFTGGAIDIGRGIQYEQQSLEAGTLTVYLDNHDGAFTFGNVLSPYWPNIGDTDVPIRLRAIWAGSLTPYVVMFSGYTDDVIYGVDSSTYYGFAKVTASDSWSRLTQQMLSLVAEEALFDNPVAFMSCNQTGGNTIVSGPYSVPVQAILSSNNQVPLGVYPTSTFTGGAISIAGGSGLSCWQSGNTQAANAGSLIGYTLAWLPSAPLPVGNGITVEFWWSPVSVYSQQTNNNIIVLNATSGENQSVFTLYIATSSNPTPYLSYMTLNTYDATTGAQTTTVIGKSIAFYSTTEFATAAYYISVNIQHTQMTVTVNPGGTALGFPTETATITGLNLSQNISGLFWGGGLGQIANFGDTAVADIVIYNYLIPPSRTAAHYVAGQTAFVGESDAYRLARIAGYAGFVPIIGMRGLNLPVPPAADVDMVTGATDTNTQVASAYFTNIAATTFAAMFINGPGTLIYRRRNEWYNRPVGQWVLGENDSQLLALNINSLSSAASVAGWTTGNSATLTSGSAPAGGPYFVPFAGLFSGNGSTANPFIITSANAAPAVTPGAWYQFTAWMLSLQGWTTATGGVQLGIQFYTSGGAAIGSITLGPVFYLPASAVAYSSVGPVRAPATAATARVTVQVNGTPPGSTGFYVAQASLFQVTPDYAAGANVPVIEAPYQPGFQMSSDRAQLFNNATLTQYGTNLVSSFTGTSVLFTPSSGVIVIVTNTPSVLLRGEIPYTATVYLNNTASATPYYLNEGSIEDEGGWVTQTLGSPLFRPDKVTVTPAATPAALATGLYAEVGDTILFRRRPFGSPGVQMITYLSKMSQQIDISTGTWTVQFELSPFPGGTILACDDVVRGVLTGQDLLGW